LFIDGGPVVQLRETGGAVEVLDDPEPSVAYRGPMAVLVDRYSASASEIFAAAIQDYGRGLVIGQQTYGKGTVQNLIPLDRYALGPQPEFGQLTVTIGKFYRVTGESTQHRGVEPDVTLPSDIDMKTVGESALEAALPWDRIAGVPFRSWDRREDTLIPTLLTEESQRAEKDADYRWLVQSIAALDTAREQKTVSLNLASRKEERAQQEAQRLTRENTRRAAKGLPAFKTIEELEKDANDAKDSKAKDKDQDKDIKDTKDEADIVLTQASEIMGDIVAGVRPITSNRNPPATVKAETKPAPNTKPN
jgi:carboxyl-terminal processing protease